MKNYKILIIVLLLSSTQACQNKKLATNQMELSGVIQKQGTTTYQYGTHTITNGKKIYALKSSTLNLNDYLKENVTIIGEKIPGYPIENGPEYLEVLKIK